MQALSYHNLCVSPNRLVCDVLQMDNQSKNGGPNFLREWRVFRGMTQQQLADAVGTNANMVQYLENGERGLSAKWLRRLAPVLDTTFGMILDHDPHNLDSDIIAIWATASNRVKRQITDVAKAIVRTGTDDA